MVAITADQFAAQMRQELWWLGAARWLLHPDREREQRWTPLRWVLWPVAALFAVVYAQALPFLVERSVRPILPHLPSTTDRELLARIEDFFRLLYESLSMFGRFSLARSKVAYWLDELDEQIDMLEFTRRHGSALDATIAELGVHHARRSGSD